jgi:hypothetical protein
VGSERVCFIKLGRKTFEGKAHLESNEVLIRGEGARTVIPFNDILRVSEARGQLTIVFSGGSAVLQLGKDAERWAEKIRNPKSRIDKLGIKSNHHVAVVGVKDVGFIKELRARATFVSMAQPIKDADAIFLGATTLHGLRELPELVPYIKRNGAIWTVTRKRKDGIKDTDVRAAAKAAGLVDVKVVSFSDTHSANKFVIPKGQR